MTPRPADIESAETARERGPAVVRGRHVVLAMFALGIASTLGIWTYWKLHLAPFMPLQKALVAEFPRSSPRVDGGRHKPSEPSLLRIVLRVDYTPEEGDSRVVQTVARIVAIAREHLDFRNYDEFEIYLVHYPPEKSPEQYRWKRQMAEVMADG